jgi:hypothetical protein
MAIGELLKMGWKQKKVKVQKEPFALLPFCFLKCIRVESVLSDQRKRFSSDNEKFCSSRSVRPAEDRRGDIKFLCHLPGPLAEEDSCRFANSARGNRESTGPLVARLFSFRSVRNFGALSPRGVERQGGDYGISGDYRRRLDDQAVADPHQRGQRLQTTQCRRLLTKI